MKQKGFTLIELLVTMGIIAVLTGLSIFNFNQSRVRARDVQRKSDMGQLMKALELYKNDNITYPPESSNFQNVLLSNGYIKEVFNDPKGATDWTTYKYLTQDSNKNYAIMACLENKADTARTTDTAKCEPFTLRVSCNCGTGSFAEWTGTMYIVSNE